MANLKKSGRGRARGIPTEMQLELEQAPCFFLVGTGLIVDTILEYRLMYHWSRGSQWIVAEDYGTMFFDKMPATATTMSDTKS